MLAIVAFLAGIACAGEVPGPGPNPDRQPLLDSTGAYLLQVGDELSVKVFGHPELEDTVKIGPDERVSTMFFNSVRVVGKTVEQVRTEMLSSYGKYLRDPQISLHVKTHANLRVLVGGEVERPGLMPLNGNMTLLTAVLQAGGFKSTAKRESVVLVRNGGNDRPLVTRINVQEMLQGRTPDVPLQSFDVVYVPMTRIAKLDRFVDQYLRQTLPVNLNAGFTYLMSPGPAVIRFQ